MSTSSPLDPISRLQRWHLSQCDGDWEHGFGVRIETLDNPGWMIKIDLDGTGLESRSFVAVSYGLGAAEPNNDWLSCKVEGTTFEAAGGPEKLAEMIVLFLDWAGG